MMYAPVLAENDATEKPTTRLDWDRFACIIKRFFPPIRVRRAPYAFRVRRPERFDTSGSLFALLRRLAD